MKKIVTALANPELNNELINMREFEIITPDIQYQEGIFEILEEKQIDILILSELLKGKDDLRSLLQKIKKLNSDIKIILLLEKENIDKIRIAKEEKVEKILYHHKVSIKEMIEILKELPTRTNIEEEIKNIKKLIIETQKNSKKNIIKKLKENIKPREKKQIENNLENNIISVAGGHGTGKSIITVSLAIQLKKENKKVLILDFDLLNESIHTIFGKKKTNQKNEDYKTKINTKIDLICASNLLFSSKKMDILKINQLLEKLKKEYDVILIDVSSECYLEYTKFLLKLSNNIILLTEGNLLEIKKAIHLLDIYTKEWKIEKEKINIIFNKYHKNAIDEKILKNIFIEYKILGKINYNKNFSTWINQNMKNYYISGKERRQQKNIIEKIFEKPKIFKKEVS